MSKSKEILLLLFFIWTVQYCIGQDTCIIKLHTGFTGEVIKLLDSNKFEYNSYSCTHNTEEQGVYYFDDKELKLTFIDLNEVQLESRITEIKSIKNSSNKLSIKFKILKDIDSQPLEYATIMILEKEKIIAANKTNSEGEAKLSFENSSNELRLRVTFVGHQTFDLPLKFENQDYSIKINLSKRRTKIHRNSEEVVYQIARKGKDYIELSKDGIKYLRYDFTCH